MWCIHTKCSEASSIMARKQGGGGGGGLPQQTVLWCHLGGLRFNSILILPTLVRGSDLQDYPVPQMPITSPCAPDPQVVNHSFPVVPSLGSINLLEWFTELGKPFYVLDYGFIVKGYNLRKTRQKRCIGQGMGTGCWASAPSPGAPPSFTSPHEHKPAWKLSKPCPFGVLWRLH